MAQRRTGTRRYLHVAVSEAMYEEVLAAGGGRYSPFVVGAVRRALLRSPDVDERFKVVQLSPRSDDQTVDQMLDWILSRRPVVDDLLRPEHGIGRAVSGGGWELDTGIRRALYGSVSPVQARRVERLLKGATLEDIGESDGCSRQAVHTSVRRALAKLKTDVAFVRALVELNPDCGLTPDQLMSAASASRNGASP